MSCILLIVSCLLLLSYEACRAIPWQHLGKILLIDLVSSLLLAIGFILLFSIVIADVSTLAERVLSLTAWVFAISRIIHYIVLFIPLDGYYRKLFLLKSLTSPENSLSTLKEMYRLGLKPFVATYFTLCFLYVLYVWQLFQLHPLNEITLISSSDILTFILTLLRALSPLIIPLIANLLASEGEYKGIRKTVLPEFFVYGVNTAQGKLVLSAFAKNSSPLEFIVEGEKYSIPPNEQGRVILSYRGSRVLGGQRITILPQKTLELELYLEPTSQARNDCIWGKGGCFALIHLRFVHYERSGPLTSLFKTLLGLPVEELHKERNVVLVCYLNPQDGRAEIIYELPSRL